MKTGIFLQVRLGSSRLPRKALLPLAGEPVLVHVLNQLNRLEAPVRAVLTDDPSRNDLEPLVLRAGWSLFVGDPENVLDRYVQAARFFSVDQIIRATGDNPLVSPQLAALTRELRERSKADYAAHTHMPLGTGVEVILTSALERAWGGNPDAYEREHVCPYLYRRPEVFHILREPAPRDLQGTTRLTLDTPEDYDFLRTLFENHYKGHPLNYQDLPL